MNIAPGASSAPAAKYSEVGRRQPEVDTSTPCSIRPSANASTSSSPGRAHVACDEHAVGAGEGGEADTEGVRDVSVELIGHRASDVVRLDDLIEDVT